MAMRTDPESRMGVAEFRSKKAGTADQEVPEGVNLAALTFAVMASAAR
jgi:hypothetical protein